MKKLTMLGFIPLIATMASCNLLDNNVTEFGNASFVGINSEVLTDTTYFMVNDVKYVDVGMAEDNVNKNEYIAALNGKDKYSFQFYIIADYDGLLYVHAFSKINMASLNRIYASNDAGDIPASFIYDIPHHDTWLDGGALVMINDIKYVRYGSFLTGLTVGDVYLANDTITYYNVEGYNDWLCSPNRSRDGFYDLYYVQTITSLPSEIVWASYTY